MSSPSDTPALNSDGTLKDAADMEWDYSPTQTPASLTIKLPARPVPSSPTLSRAIATSSGSLKIISSTPADFQVPNSWKRKAANSVPAETSNHAGSVSACTHEQTQTRARTVAIASSSSKKISALAAITRVRQNTNGLLREASSTVTVTSIDDGDANTDDMMSEPAKKKRRRGGGAADILTVFKPLDADDLSQGYICEPCM
jgi:hypothetical protein